MDILVLQRKGLTQRQIAKKLVISRNTVKKYIENQGYPERDRSKPNRKSLLDRFRGNLAAWLEEDMEYKATWIYDRLRPMGFSGSYEIVKRAVHAIKEERQRIAYVVPHTLVGEDLVLRVKGRSMRIFADDHLIVTYDIPEGKGHLVQDKRFYEALKKDHEMNRRKYGQGRRGKGRAKCTISPLKALYDMDVEIRSPRMYDYLIGEVRI